MGRTHGLKKTMTNRSSIQALVEHTLQTVRLSAAEISWLKETLRDATLHPQTADSAGMPIPPIQNKEAARAMIERHLLQAERHISVGEKNLLAQRERVAQLEEHGLDGSEARRLLMQFEELHEMHLEHRQDLEKELSQIEAISQS